MSTVAKRSVNLRVHQDDVKRIDQLARQHRLNRTDYMVKAALGKLDHVGIEQRLDEHAQRLEHLEQRVSLAYE